MASIGDDAMINMVIVFPNLPKNKENEIVAWDRAIMITQLFMEIDIDEMLKMFPYYLLDCNPEIP